MLNDIQLRTVLDKRVYYIKYRVAIVGKWLTWLFGSWDTAIGILILFIVLYYYTGIIIGYVNKELSSDMIVRKAVIFIVLIIAVALNRLLNTGSWVFCTLVCYFYIANGGLNFIENCGASRLPIPEKIKDALAQLKEGEKKSRGNKI